eukprot:c18500_g1_i2.p1 GENE.c18500_g1_i2~~c18500_g1_i2.p1  ORF type:complete len:383 (-),score=54.29 c18500_g1_i2:56-1204(-)
MSAVDTLGRSLWTCGQCGNGMNTKNRCPRFLECGHIFCTECLTSMCGKAGGVSITCPHDQTRTTIDPRLGISALLRHVVFLAQYQSLANTDSQSDPPQTPTCEVCDEKHPPTHFCRDCVQFMCASTAAAHKGMKMSWNHVLVGSDEVGRLRRLEPDSVCQTCQDHQQPLLVYDVQCDRLVCALCVTIGRHSGHQCKEPHLVVDDLRVTVERLAIEARSGVERLRGRLESISSISERIARIGTDACAEINRYFDTIRACVNARERRLLEEVKIAVKDKQFELQDQHQCISNVLACAQRSVELGLVAIQGATSVGEMVSARDTVRAAATHVQQRKEGGFGYLNVSDTGTVFVELKQSAINTIRDLLDTQTAAVRCRTNQTRTPR